MSRISMEPAKKYLFLHGCILLYSVTSLLSKYASGFEFLSGQYLLLLFLMVAVLGVYAILWQQAIKGFSPSVAYSNKSVTTIWVLLFSVLIFGEEITLGNVIGTALIITGVVLVAHGDD